MTGQGMDRDTVVSIHAPARGATLDEILYRVGSIRFNPRPREGGDV